MCNKENLFFFFFLIISFTFTSISFFIWLGSRVTTSCLRLLTAHDFECCCTSFDVYGINEVSTVMAGTSSQMLFNILLISQWDKSHTFQGFSVQK